MPEQAIAERGSEVPTMSVVIPAYNVAPYVRAAVESALDQTYRQLEVLVVNDGSTDETLNVIQTVAAERDDPRLKIINRSNGGLSAARNTGIAHAQGELIGFLDADDTWEPAKAALHVAAMDADQTIGISFSHSLYIEDDGTKTGTVLLADEARPSLHQMIRRNHIGNGSSPVVRRLCFAAAGVFDEELKSCEDYEMWCRILWATDFRAELVPLPLTVYRLRRSSLSFNFAGFVRNADLAVERLRCLMKRVPDRVFRAGRAEHYRIAAWKAATAGNDQDARRLLLSAVAFWPWLVFSDWRVLGTAAALTLPARHRNGLAKIRQSFGGKLNKAKARAAREVASGPAEA